MSIRGAECRMKNYPLILLELSDLIDLELDLDYAVYGKNDSKPYLQMITTVQSQVCML